MTNIHSSNHSIAYRNKLRKPLPGFQVTCCGRVMNKQHDVQDNGDITWTAGCPLCGRVLWMEQLQEPKHQTHLFPKVGLWHKTHS